MICDNQQKKLANMIRECRYEMKNDLFTLHNALGTQSKRNVSKVSCRAIKSSKATRPGRFHESNSVILSSTTSSSFDQQFKTSDYFYKNDNGSSVQELKKRKFFNTRKERLNKLHRIQKRKQQSLNGFTYKHYDLYLLTKKRSEVRRNILRTSTIKQHSGERFFVEKSAIQNISTTYENQTFFEPQFSSSPISKCQKTSTPTKSNQSPEIVNKISFQNGSRFKFINSTNNQQYGSSDHNDNTYQNIQSFEFCTNMSTPKVARRFGKNNGLIPLNDHSNIVKCSSKISSAASGNSVTTVIKLCIKPFKNLIQHKKVKRTNKVFF